MVKQLTRYPAEAKRRRQRWPRKFALKHGANRWIVTLTRQTLYVKDDDGSRVEVGGFCAPGTHRIVINTEKNHPDRNTAYKICEEIGHAICDALEIDDDDEDNHKTLRQIVWQILSFMRDNPKFIDRLQDNLKKD